MERRTSADRRKAHRGGRREDDHAGRPVISATREGGYISNVEDEAKLLEPGYRAEIVEALARAIEADVAARIAG